MQDFEQTKNLGTDALHTLLVDGDARERVFAIWALALRSPSAMLMANQLREEPDPGVRRALCVVLAGNGEIDLVVAMARHDPSVYVRASAVQMVVRFCAADRAPWSLVTGRLTDAPEVRAAVIGQIDATQPPELHAAAVAALRDPDEMVRREAFETCTKLRKAGVLSAATLVEALDRAGEGERANTLAVWFGSEKPEALCELLVSASRAVRDAALHVRPALVKTTLAPLYENDPVLYERLEWFGRVSYAHASLRLLLEVAIANPRRHSALNELETRLRRIETIDDDLKPLLHALLASFERQLVLETAATTSDGELAIRDDGLHGVSVWAQTRERFKRLPDLVASFLL